MSHWRACADGYLWAGMLLWGSSSWLQGKSWKWKTCQQWVELWASTPSLSSWACSSMPPLSCPPSTSWLHAKTLSCSSEVSYRPSSLHWAPPPGKQHTCTMHTLHLHSSTLVYITLAHLYTCTHYTCTSVHLYTLNLHISASQKLHICIYVHLYLTPIQLHIYAHIYTPIPLHMYTITVKT